MMTLLTAIQDFLSRLISKDDREFTLREFKNSGELTLFVLSDWSNFHLYREDIYDCDDFAITFQREALKRGYITSLYLTPDGRHMKNMAIVQNHIWLIEPQTDVVTYYGPLDKELEASPRGRGVG